MIIWDIIQVKCFSLGEHNSNSICIAALVKTTVIKIAMAKSIAIQTALVNSTVIKTALVKSTVTQIALVVNVEKDLYLLSMYAKLGGPWTMVTWLALEMRLVIPRRHCCARLFALLVA